MDLKQAKLLTDLMNVMVTIPPKAFDISHWVDYGNYVEKEKVGSKTVELKCGTTACAVGWAAITIPSWKKAFKFTPHGGMYTTLTDKYGKTYDNEFEAVAAFLGITADEADYMFSDHGYKEEETKADLCFTETFKITKPMLFAHCKKVLDDHGFVWAY